MLNLTFAHRMLPALWLWTGAAVAVPHDATVAVVPAKTSAAAEYASTKVLALMASIRDAVALIQPNLPLRMDDDTVLISVSAEGMQAIYSYQTDHPLAHYSIAEFAAEHGAQLRTKVCSDAFIPGLRLGGRLHYVYLASDGQAIASFTYDATACGL